METMFWRDILLLCKLMDNHTTFQDDFLFRLAREADE